MRRISRMVLRVVDGEYILRAYDTEGRRIPEADYFTSDKQDALDTLAAINQNVNNPQHYERRRRREV